jgi:hypothetical protein
MKLTKIPAGILKNSPDRYITIDVGEGEDYEYGFHRMEIVRIKKPRLCFCGQREHMSGAYMLKETALVDGKASTCFLCIPCADRYLAFEDGDEDSDGNEINPHNYFCDGTRRPALRT